MKSKEITIGYISPDDPKDRRPQSGTNFYVCQALKQQGYKVAWIPVHANLIAKALLTGMKVLRRIFKVDMPGTESLIYCRLLGNTASQAKIDTCDILFCPFTKVYGHKINKPYIYMADALFSLPLGYYWKDKKSAFVINEGNKLQKRILDSSTGLIFSSKWAADEAIKFYGQEKSKVHVVEFGANIDDKDIIEKKYSYNGHLDILFLGVDWKRKGGQIAVDACKWLNDNGVPSTIHIVGIRELDEKIMSLPYVNYIGFLNKNKPEQYSKLVEVIKKCQLMLLPTVAECSAIAFCEASAYGLPVFSHITGGTQNYVFDGKNGYLLPLGSAPSDFGRKIKECLESGELERMSETAKEVYRERLNWKVWGRAVSNIIYGILNK